MRDARSLGDRLLDPVNAAVASSCLLFLWLPVAVLLVFSFSGARQPHVWGGFSTRWYADLLQNADVRRTAGNSFFVAVCVAALATVLGTSLALGLDRRARTRSTAGHDVAVMVPILVPDVVQGISLLLAFTTAFAACDRLFGAAPTLGRGTIVLAHTAFTTSYVAILSDMEIGESPGVSAAGAREFFFPLRIPAGASVAARIRGANATAGTVRVAARFFGRASNGLALPVGSFSQTLGANTTYSEGADLTPGNAADGSWVDLGATTRDMWWWQLGYCIDNTTITAEYTYLEVAYGDASNKKSIFTVMHCGTTNETCGLAASNHLLWPVAYCQVKAGEHIYVRGRCNNAPDTGYSVTVTGVGG